MNSAPVAYVADSTKGEDAAKIHKSTVVRHNWYAGVRGFHEYNACGARPPEAAREAVVDAVRATADALNASLEPMKVVEEMRGTLRQIRDMNKLDSN